MAQRFWFRPKSFGYGATPTTWEGWTFTFAAALLSLVAILPIVAAETQRWPSRRPVEALAVAVFVAIQVATIVVCRKKTDGEWRWRP